MTTSAQAEGAIDGAYTDYQLPKSYSIDWKYSRFHLASKTLTSPDKRTASTSEWDGNKAWAGQERE